MTETLLIKSESSTYVISALVHKLPHEKCRKSEKKPTYDCETQLSVLFEFETQY